MTDEKIRILYIIDYFHRTGGTERHLAQLAQYLRKDSFDCEIVVFDLGKNVLIDEMRAAGISVIHLPVAREYTPLALLRAWQLFKLMRNRRFDIVQTFHQKADTFGAVIAKLAGVKHVVSSKRDIAQLKKRHHFFMNRRLRFLFDRVIVVADAVGKVVTAKEGIDQSRLLRIYNGVDTLKYAPPTEEEVAHERERLGFAADDLVAGMVAGFRPEKNHDVFFEGAVMAMRTIPSLKILAVGGGPLLEKFRDRYRDETFSARIVFTGDVTDVARHIKAMDIGCLIPGGNEGFSNAVLEKMAMGLPMIVSDVGGNAEAVIDGQNGFVIAPGDAQGFCRALIHLCGDPERRAVMGRKSRQLGEENFSLERMCSEHVTFYRALCRA